MSKTKKKGGQVAIPFLLAFLLGIVCIGGIAMLIFSKLDNTDSTVYEMEATITVPTEENNFTLLFVLDEKGDPSPLTFTVVRVLPAQKKMILMTFPSTMLTVVNSKQYTLAESYESGGIQMAKEALANETGIAVDRYAILDSAAFQKICNICGGVMYQLPSGMEGFSDTGEPQYFGPAQIEKIVTYPLFQQEEMQRSAVTADILCDMLNQSDYDRMASTMDSNFRTLVNMMNTDISSIDYNDQKSALKYMYKYGHDIAEFRIVSGSSTDGKFILDPAFRESVAEFFTQEEE